MQRKLTVTIDEEVYNGLRAVIGPGKISRFIEELVRPHVVKKICTLHIERWLQIRTGNRKPLSGPKAHLEM